MYAVNAGGGGLLKSNVTIILATNSVFSRRVSKKDRMTPMYVNPMIICSSCRVSDCVNASSILSG